MGFEELVQFGKGKRNSSFKGLVKINCKIQKEWLDTVDFKK